MNNKIKNYVESLFLDIPRSKKANELKEELLSNMSERFDDYIKEGKTENQSYSLVISNLGDIDEMLADVIPDANFVKEVNMFRTRNAKATAIAVSMYILGFVFLIGMGGIGALTTNSVIYGVIGLIMLLLLSAVATGILVYINMSTPPEYKDRDEVKQEKTMCFKKGSKTLNRILSIYWTSIPFIYLSISFLSGKWGITWFIWVLSPILDLVIRTIYEMRYCDE